MADGSPKTGKAIHTGWKPAAICNTDVHALSIVDTNFGMGYWDVIVERRE